MSFTKGPWEYNDVAAEIRVSVSGRNFSVASIDSCFASSDEIEANARLIATAPELLEALEFVLRSATPSCVEHPAMYFAWKNAKAAIAKAKGESK